eukprot:Tamp_19541.p2 GENE.Tamp_19541~~Tamp_19541.p2  ORF type:complete len:255 (+),score=76.70 Tamp_19541:110-766(+)
MSVNGIPEADQKWYMLGVEIAGQMGDLPKDITEANEVAAFVKGIEAQFTGSVDRSVVNAQNGQALAEILAGRRDARKGPEEAAKEAEQAALTARSNAKLVVGTEMKEGVKKMPSGLLIETLVEGTGATPEASSTVKVHYTGKLADGSVFDSSVERGEPASFAVAQVVKGFAEGILNMKVGGKVVLTMAPELAYGPAAVGPIPANSALQFEVELIDIVS